MHDKKGQVKLAPKVDFLNQRLNRAIAISDDAAARVATLEPTAMS
jgi:hypothetical protein